MMKMKKLVPILICLLICNFAFALGSGDTSLLTWWKMDDAGGTIVTDYAYNMDGTIGEENSWTYDSLYFPGQDFNYGASKVGCDESVFSQITDEITITFWAKNDMPNCTGNCYFFTAKIGSDRVLQIDLTGKTTSSLPFKAADTDNTAWVWDAWSPENENYTDPNLWNYYSFTKNASTGTMKIYINGQLRTVSTGSNTSMAGIDSFEICGSSANWHQWAGWVKDFRIYNKELYSEQINILKKQYDPSLITWYKFDETSGTTVADSSGNGFDAACNVDTSNWDADGGYDGSGCLDNNSQWTNQKVTVPAEVFTTIDQQITIMFWTQLAHPTLSEGSWFNSDEIRGWNSGNNYLYCRAAGSGSMANWAYGDNTVADQWHHIAFTFHSGMMKVYLDGEHQWHSTADPLPGDSIAGIDDFVIGSGGSEYWDSFHGKMDDFRIYDRVLNYLEINRIINPEMFAGDFNFDTTIDGKDLELLAKNWLEDGNYIMADADNDQDVDMVDYAYLAKNYAPGDWEKSGWTLTFHDEFDGDDIDGTKWDIGSWSGYSYHNHFPSDDPDVYTVSNGTLKLHNVIKDYYDPGTQTTKPYGSGKLQTTYQFDQAFGYFECSAKLPVGTGSFPAFWLMPLLPGGTWWPNAEIDIMEHVYDSSIGDVGANLHWNDYYDDHVSWAALFAGDDTGYQFNPSSTAFNDFHVYAMKWEPGAMYFYVDGYNYATFRDEDVPDHMDHDEPASYNPDNIKTPTNPGYLILNNGLAGWMTPDTQGATSTFEVDYIRVYRKNE